MRGLTSAARLAAKGRKDMRKLMRITGRVLAIAAIVLLAAGLWKRDEIMCPRLGY